MARLPEFKEFAHQIVMQIAAMAPKYPTVEDSSRGTRRSKKKKSFESDALKDKPAEMAEKIKSRVS